MYKFISGSITANSARTAALNQTAYGSTGYLVTITSAEENAFVAARLQGDGWMGASDAASEGDWKWLDGPEAGTSFWSGQSGGSVQNGLYANWSSGEPNDYSTGEDCAEFYIASSKWNDLPCAGNTLSGYVVEFGAPGDLPTVVAQNFSITTVSAPTATGFTPADNATGVAVDANLVVTFSATMIKGTGNIIIKKTADDSTVETIDVTSAQVTGASSSTITINPSVTLDESTGYYVTIASTALTNASSVAYAGISSKTVWNFTTGDFTDPTISSVASSSVTSTGADITWTTNETASSKVIYGATSTYGLTTSESDTSPRVTSHTVSLTGLPACTLYHYAVVSVDGSSNDSTSSDNTFITTGCPASTTPSKATSEAVTVSTGGTSTFSQSNRQMDVRAPSNFKSGSSSVAIQIKSIEASPVTQSFGVPSSVPRPAGNTMFDVKAIINGTTVVDSFDAPITITYQYTDADIAGLQESSVWLYHYHGGSWQPLSSCNVNQSTNTISCTTTSFSVFGLFGKAQTSGGATRSSGPTTCSAIGPTVKPDLFQIDVTATTATLYFAPLQAGVTDYFISYGYAPGEERFGVWSGQGASSGVLSYTIQHLSPGVTYYFKIKARNGCSEGKWGNEMQIATNSTGGIKTRYYKDVFARVGSLLPHTTDVLGAYSTPTAPARTKEQKKTVSTTACDTYRVKAGDNLWTIAKRELGSGYEYRAIMKENALDSTMLRTGKMLRLNCR